MDRDERTAPTEKSELAGTTEEGRRLAPAPLDPWTPERLARERALRAAVLIDAVRCLLGTPGGCERGVRKAAYRWVMSRDAESPFSFENVCDSLGFDPSRLRHVLVPASYQANGALRLNIRRRRPSGSPNGPLVLRPRRVRSRFRKASGERPA